MCGTALDAKSTTITKFSKSITTPASKLAACCWGLGSNLLETTWEVLRIQQSRFCEFPVSRMFPKKEWYIFFLRNGRILI